VRISHSDLSATPGTPNMGFEGLVSKRRDRPYQAGQSKHYERTRWIESSDFAIKNVTVTLLPPNQRFASIQRIARAAA